ncbi:DUF885 domain-containing protein [Nonomuraea jiangxiensis]|uniref:Uncharacterized conserved protein, DUF885 familyt n=1 Tax=Nonomuraea jiangxiensis TaxID=633440 RepID=A0A1G9IYZ9_9ACTN|nr:DUF885 domain-containing protein [Nonomuraea jiangxiensis]SDL30246.1 Uncharacterized conserved protein, DUF885 familyt [Nonomuraea jiangxiensis]
MTPIFKLCEDYVGKLAALDPIGAATGGVAGGFVPATDYSPDGHAARAELVRRTLAELAGLSATSDADRHAAAHLRERLEAEAAWHEHGEPLRMLRGQFGLVNLIRDSVDLLPRDDDQWHDVAARLHAVPVMLASWRASLDLGLARGLVAARRQALETAAQAERFAGVHDPLVASYGDGRLADELAAAAAAAHAAYAATARYLRADYAPRAAERDGVGAERYALAARRSLGADIDPAEAYAWGWAELDRIEAEMAGEIERIRPGASWQEVSALLDESHSVAGVDAYRGWLQEQHDRAIDELHGTHFDIAEPLRKVEVTIASGSTAGSPYYTSPTEDLARPGRTWWPLGGRERFAVWRELTTVFHEGVPGHHLQIGAVMAAGDTLSRFARTVRVSGHSEGWALYAERLADELGWFADPGTRLGMLAASALRAARVVIDIGVHLDLPLPDGSRWTFEKACEVLRERGHANSHRIHPEVVRYFGWPGQAISYKLGERAWMAARQAAGRHPDFDLKRWHTAAVALGPIGLDGLAGALERIN